MATSITVLCLNARRINIKVTPNTSVLQILEQACSKQNLNPQDFDLVHQRKVLDLSLSVRFANLPNNALLELRSTQGCRQETKVAVCTQIEGGGRFIHNFPPTSSFWDIICHWTQQIGEESLKGDAVEGSQPVCLYMRKEVIGESKLKETTLRDLGLTSGSAVIRLFYRIPDTLKTQAHVESINLKPKIEDNINKDVLNNQVPQSQKEPCSGWGSDEEITGKVSSSSWNDIQPVSEKTASSETKAASVDSDDVNMEPVEEDSPVQNIPKESVKPGVSGHTLVDHSSRTSTENSHSGSQNMDTNVLEDNEEIIYVGERDAVLYDARNISSHNTEILPDDFFELTVEDARYLYSSLQKQRMDMENQVLCTQAFKEAKKMERMLRFKNTVLRIQFPNQLVLQARFATLEKVINVVDFVRQFLTNEGMDFQLFTTPPKTILNPDQALFEAGLVPASLVHFGCDLSRKNGSLLKPELMEKISSHKAACKAAALIRQSSVGKVDEVSDKSASVLATRTVLQTQIQPEQRTERDQDGKASPSKEMPSTSSATSASTVPKWFRSGPK